MPVFIVNPDGSVTFPNQSVGGIPSGPLKSIPNNSVAGDCYIALDQPVGQQLYTCPVAGKWSQMMSLGGSGCLAFTDGSLDVTNSVVRLNAANSFLAMQTFNDVVVNGSLTVKGSTNPGSGGTVPAANPQKRWSKAFSSSIHTVAGNWVPFRIPASYFNMLDPDSTEPTAQIGILPTDGFVRGNVLLSSSTPNTQSAYISVLRIRSGIEMAVGTVGDGSQQANGWDLNAPFSFKGKAGDVIQVVVTSQIGFTLNAGQGQTELLIES